jgi:ferredoxin
MKFTATMDRGIITGLPHTMASITDRLSHNVPGPFYVDASCVDCDLCRSLAPATFRRHDETGYSYVHRQPLTPDELAAAVEAMNSCPTESIGNDGSAASATDAAAVHNLTRD